MPKWVTDSDDEKTLIAALQPWFDGEGYVPTRARQSVGFILAQAKHTDIDCGILPAKFVQGRSAAWICGRSIDNVSVLGIPLRDYCGTLFRCRVLDEACLLSKRIGLKPRLRLASMRLKNDGFWSAIWVASYGSCDTKKMIRMGVLTQQRKIAILCRVV